MFYFNFKKIISLVLITSFLIPTVFSIGIKKVEAAYPVTEVGPNLAKNTLTSIATSVSAGVNKTLLSKDFIFDGIAWALKEVIIKSMVASTVEWINSGFEGNPAYITDFDGYMTDLADGIVGEWIYGSDLKFLCSPFSLEVRLALIQKFTAGKFKPRCTLSGVVENIEGAIDDLERQWDWGTWISISQDPNNNAFGSYIKSTIQINADINAKKDVLNKELNWGDGFLSFKKCDTNTMYTEDEGAVDVENCYITTPGEVFANSINESVNIGGRTLVTADEINEIVGALLGQLVKQVVGPGGLLGASKKSGSGGSYLQRMALEQGDFSEIVKKINEAVIGDLKYENQYLNAKSDSLDAVLYTKTKLEDLKQCYISKAQEAKNDAQDELLWNSLGWSISADALYALASTTQESINKNIIPLEIMLKPQIELSNKNISSLKLIQNEAKSAVTATALSSVSSKYQILITGGDLHDFEEALRAQDERDGVSGGQIGVLEKMTNLSKDAEEKLIECNGYFVKNKKSLFVF